MSSANAANHPHITPSKAKRPAKRSLVGRLSAYAVTLLFGVAAVGLVAGGTTIIAERAAAVEGPDPAPLLSVATTPIAIEPGYRVERRFVGQVEAAQRTAVAFEQGGTVTEIAVDEGDAVAQGALIARLDTRLIDAEADRLRATRQALSAQQELARRTSERQQKLNEQGFASTQSLDQASLGLAELSARIAEIDAALVGIAVQLEKAELNAPFAGRIAMRSVDVGAAVGSGAPVVTLLEDRAPQFRVGIDPDLAGELSRGSGARIEIGADTHDARFVSLLPDVDPATRTRVALFELASNAQAPFGITGTLIVDETVAADGAWVPVSALKQGVRGLWTITTVQGTDDATVEVEAVEIIHADATNAFVRGTFRDGAQLVTGGAHRIVSGQRVRIEAGE